MIANWVSFFYTLGESTSELAKTANFRVDTLSFADFDVCLDFNNVCIKIKKNKDHYTFIILSQGV